MPFKINYLIKVLVLFFVYVLTARFGLSLDPVNQFASLIWLPSGISIAILLIFGINLWPAIAAGAFTANLLTGAPPPTALQIGIGNTLEATLATFLLKKDGFRNSLSRLKDVLFLVIFGAVLSAILGATIGVSSLFFGNIIEGSDFFFTWLAWFIGDMISILVITPLLLVWSTKLHDKVQKKLFLEPLLIIFTTVIIFLIIFKDFLGLTFGNNSSIYLIFPPLIWAALRFGQIGAVTIIFFLSVITTFATWQNFGPFATRSLNENLLSLQIFMAITSVTAMILAAVITERKHSEKVKDEFISIAAHELRTPITTIKGYVQLLQQYLKNTQNKKGLSYVSHLNEPIDNLMRLITDFFDVSKIETGKLEFQKENFDFDKLVKEVVEDNRKFVTRHKINVEGETKKQILADRYRIRQVLTNLISNAIKFSPKASLIKMHLSSDEHKIVFSVEDFGIGISKRDMNRIFERFYQANVQIRQSVAGLGLGLYLSAEIVKQHRGRIWVKSQKGKGTTFFVSLPIQ